MYGRTGCIRDWLDSSVEVVMFEDLVMWFVVESKTGML